MLRNKGEIIVSVYAAKQFLTPIGKAARPIVNVGNKVLNESVNANWIREKIMGSKIIGFGSV